MNMMNCVTVYARLLQKEELRAQGLLALITASGIIYGVPVLANYDSHNLDEKLMMKILSDFHRPSAPNFLLGDDDVFMLRNVHVEQGNKLLEMPCILVRFDAILGLGIVTNLPG